jgi:hypothetical protein
MAISEMIVSNLFSFKEISLFAVPEIPQQLIQEPCQGLSYRITVTALKLTPEKGISRRKETLLLPELIALGMGAPVGSRG